MSKRLYPLYPAYPAALRSSYPVFSLNPQQSLSALSVFLCVSVFLVFGFVSKRLYPAYPAALRSSYPVFSLNPQ